LGTENNYLLFVVSESIESRQKIEDLEATIMKLRHRNVNLERSIDNIVIINKSIVNCNNDQPARSYFMKEVRQNSKYNHYLLTKHCFLLHITYAGTYKH